MIPALFSRRLLSQSSLSPAILPLQFPFSFSFRNRSSRSGKLIEIDLDSPLHSSSSISSSSLADGDGESGAIGLRGLEESINSILALRYTPDWIPFLPGASFWVPPRTVSAVQYLGSLASPFSEEDSLSFASSRGWPCFDSLSQLGNDASSTKTLELEMEADFSRPRAVELQVQVLTPSQGGSDSGDDE